MSGSKVSLSSTQSSASRAIEGVRQNLSKMAEITLDGTVYTPDTLIALLKAYVDLVTALSAAHDQLHALVDKEGPARAQLTVVLRWLNAFVTNLYGQDPVKLGEFGFTPRKVGVEKVATKFAAIEKREATRIARHTMGSRQKLAITGAPPAPTPPVAPSPPAAPAQPVTNGAPARA